MTLAVKSVVHLTGLPASVGEYRGPAVIVADLNDLTLVDAGCVLITREATADYVCTLRRAGALVTTGGILSNLATIARELGIPAVLLEDADIAMLHTGQSVRVVGTTGTVEVEQPS